VLGRVGVGELELVVDLSAEHRHAAWGINAQLHALTFNGQDGYRDVFADQQALLAFAAQNQHVQSVLTWAIVCVVV
jgi:hypothetical protein